MIKIQNLHFSYGHTQVLQGISTEIDSGKVCAFFGPNGSGKTTLFKCCLNFLHPNGGEIFINRQSTRTTSIENLARLVSFVPQEHKPPFPYLVKEVVLMGRTPHMGGGLFSISAIHQQKTVDALELLNILDLADAHYNELSGGQRQLVMIARAIAQDTSVIFLDEPTSALDYHNQIKIWQILRQLAKNGKTIVVCSHDPNQVTWFCDQVVMINQGKVVADDTPQKCLTDSNLETIYQDSCSIREMHGIRMVLPRVIASSNPTNIE